MQVSDLQVCVKSREVGRVVLGDSVRLNFLSLRRLSAGMFLKIQLDISELIFQKVATEIDVFVTFS